MREDGEWAIHTEQVSYLSRLAETDQFIQLAPVELQRRQVAAAARGLPGERWGRLESAPLRYVFSPSGANSGLFSLRGLSAAGKAFYRAQPAGFADWFVAWRWKLKTIAPRQVVADLHPLSLTAYNRRAPESVQRAIDDAHDYGKSRLAMIQYAQY